MLTRRILFYLIFSLSSRYFVLCNPIQTPNASPNLAVAIQPLDDRPVVYFDFRTNPGFLQPLERPGVQACVSTALDILRTQDPRATVTQEAIRVQRNRVWFHSYFLSPEYTWYLLGQTIQLVTDSLKRKGYFTCEWQVFESNDQGGPGKILGGGFLKPVFSSLYEATNNTARRQKPQVSFQQNATYLSTHKNELKLNLQVDNPPHPLNAIDADGCFSLALAGVHGHDFDQPFPRRGGRIQAGGVILDIDSVSSEYTWGLFDYTIRSVRAELWSRGWWSCSWEIGWAAEGGGIGVAYARGRMWSPLGKGIVAEA